MPSSAGEHSPQTFTLVGGGGQGRLQTSWKTGDRRKTKGAPGLRSRLQRPRRGPPYSCSAGAKALLECPSHPSWQVQNIPLPHMFLLSGSRHACCCPHRAVGWAHCSVGVGWALSREGGSAGGLQVLGELLGAGISQVVKHWIWKSGSLNSNSGPVTGLASLGLSFLIWNMGTVLVLFLETED